MNIRCCWLHKPAFTLTEKGPPDILLVTAGVRKMRPDFSPRRRECSSSGRWLSLLSISQHINNELIKYQKMCEYIFSFFFLNYPPPKPLVNMMENT